MDTTDTTHGRDVITFQLEIDRDSQPIEGRLLTDAGEVKFAGWLGLASVLEGLLHQK